MLGLLMGTNKPGVGKRLACAAVLLLTLGTAAAAQAASPGTLVAGFGSGGLASTGANTRLFGTTVQSNGDILAVGESGVGSSPDLLLARFTPSGALDHSFGSGGLVHGPAISGFGSLGRAVAVQSNGQIVVVGEATDPSGTYPHGMLIERFNSNGGIDTTFGSHGVADVLTGASAGQGYAVAIQADGKIVATGAATAAGSDGTAPRVAVVRLKTNGSLDTSFRGGGTDVIDLGAYSSALAVALQSNGDIVIAGSQAPGLQVTNALIARLTTTGTLDSSFGTGGAYAHQYAQGAASSTFNGVAIQSNGDIVAAGAATAGNTGADTIVVRFTSAGHQDGSFGSGGVVYTPSATQYTSTGATPGSNGVVIAPNGDIITAGTFDISVETYATLWAFSPSGAAVTSFGTGGKAVLTNSAGNNTEDAALAISPVTGDLVAVGDGGRPYSGSYAGMAALYVGYGPPKAPPTLTFKLSLKGVDKSYKTSTVAKHGLKLTAGCNEACSLTAELTVSAKTAKQLHLKVHGKSPVKIASGKATLKASGTKSITLKLSKSLAKALEKQKSVGLTLELTGKASATNKSLTTKKNVTFKR
jgi:uncharacterized delta-60 repeat protein